MKKIGNPETLQRQASDPSTSVWVSASAGTGKTKVLTDRVLSLLLEGTPPQRLLCLTFTKAAAAEMATRIADELSNWSILDDKALKKQLSALIGHSPNTTYLRRARRLFAHVLDVPGGLHIETIHAFCQSVLRRFPLEAGVPPHFSIMDERDTAEALKKACKSVLEIACRGTDKELTKAIITITNLIHEAAFLNLLDALASERHHLSCLFDRLKTTRAVEAEIHRFLYVPEGSSPDDILSAACMENAADEAGLQLAVQGLQQGSDTDQGIAVQVAGWLFADTKTRQETFEEYAALFLSYNLTRVRKTLATTKALNAVPEADAVLRNEAHRLFSVVQRHRAAKVAQITSALPILGKTLLDIYTHYKVTHALLDYDDLILIVRDLLCRPDMTSWVAFKLDGGIDHLLIDEAQDTSPEQWDIIEALAKEFFSSQGAGDTERTVFAVGDAKQSIYSFQRADPSGFERMRSLFSKDIPAAGKSWREVELNVSFRSTRAVLEAVDTVFAHDAAKDGVVLDGRPITHHARRDTDGGLVEVWPPMKPQKEKPSRTWKLPTEHSTELSPRLRLARLMAQRIHAMIGSEILESKGRLICASDIMILVRRRNAFVEDLVRELKRLSVPTGGVDRMKMNNQMAIMDLIALGNCLLLTEDDLTLATVLKGPFIGFDEETLFDLAHGRKGKLWEELCQRANENSLFRTTLDLLTDLQQRAEHSTPFEFYTYVLGPLKGRRQLIAHLGWEAVDPINEFMLQIEIFERTHIPSLRRLLHWLQTNSITVKRNAEELRDAVRIMTVHGAKGLQAPIVFLPDTLQVPKQLQNLLWVGEPGEKLPLWIPRSFLHNPICDVERQKATKVRDEEYRRLLYVAMTRAKDRLYICGWLTKKTPPPDCWYALIVESLKNKAECLEDGTLRITSPQVLKITSKTHDLKKKKRPSLPKWACHPPPPEPSLPTSLIPSRPEVDNSPLQESLADNSVRYFQRGQLIHRLLQTLPNVPRSRRRVAAEAFLEHSSLSIDAKSCSKIIKEVLDILEDPQFAPLFGSKSRAEVPITGLISTQVLSGQIDRLVITENIVTIIDYKTNQSPPRRPEAVSPVYLRQMAIYREVLQAIYPERAIHCLLLWTDVPCIMTLPNNLLNKHTP